MNSITVISKPIKPCPGLAYASMEEYQGAIQVPWKAGLGCLSLLAGAGQFEEHGVVDDAVDGHCGGHGVLE